MPFIASGTLSIAERGKRTAVDRAREDNDNAWWRQMIRMIVHQMLPCAEVYILSRLRVDRNP